jgi:hypothetical protein
MPPSIENWVLIPDKRFVRVEKQKGEVKSDVLLVKNRCLLMRNAIILVKFTIIRLKIENLLLKNDVY